MTDEIINIIVKEMCLFVMVIWKYCLTRAYQADPPGLSGVFQSLRQIAGCI
jgi:hypothetical protein